MACKTCDRDEDCAGNDSGIFPCPDYVPKVSHDNPCEYCPIAKDGNRSESMCGHLDCWNEYNEYEKTKISTPERRI